MRRASPEVWALLEPVVRSMGYEFVGAQYGQAENGLTLRVFIDTENGVVLDDCAAVSRQLSATLDVEDVIPGAYLLEVSSPGLERPLFTVEQFRHYTGEVIRVKMNTMILGRKNFKGVLTAVEDQLALVEVDGEIYDLPIDEVESATLVIGP